MPCRLPNLLVQRQAAGLSRDQLAHLANLSIYWVEQIETGGVTSNEVAQRIADALGVSLVTLGQDVLG